MQRERRLQLLRYGLVLAGALIVGLIYFVTRHGDEKPVVAKDEKKPAAISVKTSSDEKVGVHVAGAVRRPGVYWMKSGSRVDDAVKRAGGVLDRGDVTGLNLAAKVEDGRQVVVPTRNTPGGQKESSGVAAGVPGDVTASSNEGGTLLNLNTATVEQLDALDGVGPATAKKIFEFRQQRGGFSRIEDLQEIPGIGEKKLAMLREQVTL